MKIYYFLGHLPAQMNHGLSLYSRLPGECIVTTDEARDYCLRHQLPCQFLDRFNINSIRYDFSRIPKTLIELNQQKGVIFFFDTFTGISRLSSLTKVMLFHGNGIKLRWFRPWRVECLKKFDYLTSLGPFWEENLIARGVAKEKLLPIGQTRCDEIIRNPHDPKEAEKIYRTLESRPKSIITYMPTWYGTTSVTNLGKKIVAAIRENYLLIIRPHPETPAYLLNEYERLADKRPHVLYAPEGRYPEIELMTLLKASHAFIGDMSSVLFDMLLTGKPVLFAIDGNPLLRWVTTSFQYRKIQELFDASIKITQANVTQLEGLLARALAEGAPRDPLQRMKKRFFYNLNGKAVDDLLNFVMIKTGLP